jgi:thiamine kinase-like enzyme
MPISIEEVVENIPDWQGKPLAVQPLSGGLTNTNFRVEVEGVPYFVRIPGPKTELLAIDRKNEVYNTKAAAQVGVGPEVIFHLPDHDVMVLEFIFGETMSKESCRRQAGQRAGRIPSVGCTPDRAFLPTSICFVSPSFILRSASR